MNTSRRFQHVAVLYGGSSAEREVSLESGKAASRGLREAGYDVAELDVKGPDFELPEGAEAVFIALHGAFGEDGSIQAIFEERRIPYTGAGVAASRMAFDKKLSKEIFVAGGIPTPPYEILHHPGDRTLRLPVVVKPLRQGSSIGVAQVFDESDWWDACRNALAGDGEVLVESYIAGAELTVGLVDATVLPVLEIRAPRGYYDYHAKYTQGASDYLVPAPLSPSQTATCRDIARRAFEALACRGMARVDFRMDDRGELYVLEVNTIPGLTETSLLPKAAQAVGIDFPELCDRIMSLASLDNFATSP